MRFGWLLALSSFLTVSVFLGVGYYLDGMAGLERHYAFLRNNWVWLVLIGAIYAFSWALLAWSLRRRRRYRLMRRVFG